MFGIQGQTSRRLVVPRQSVAAILQDDPKPTAAQTSTVVATWERANENFFSILFFTTERSANNVVKKYMDKTGRMGPVTASNMECPGREVQQLHQGG